MHNGDALHQKSGKASFELIYDLEDPREYFNTLGSFDYCVAQHGQHVFSTLIEARREGESSNGIAEKRTKILDVCCSYGINAALLKHETTLDELYERYGSEELADLSSEELERADAAFYEERVKEAAPEVIGVDVASNAVSYGIRSGALDAGFAENLEENEPTEELRRAVSGVDLLTITGGVGYISERTFERLLDCMVEGPEGRVPWLAVFALRWVSYEDISEALSRYGLVTEKLAGHTFTQRRFTDTAEREYVLEELAQMGVDTTGKEDTGWYHADFYLSRPVEEAKIPLETLLSPALRG
jgi:SAM-dependent methyltransferase